MAKEELEDRSERREHPRYAVHIPVDVKIGNEKFSGLMVDISIAGLRISVSQAIRPSAYLEVTFTGSDSVRIFSQAVWTLSEISAGLPAYQVGLKIQTVQVNNRDLQGMAERTAFLERLLQ